MQPVYEPSAPQSEEDPSFAERIDAWGRRELHLLGEPSAIDAPPESMILEVRSASFRRRAYAAGALALLMIAILLAIIAIRPGVPASTPAAPLPRSAEPHTVSEDAFLPTGSELRRQNASLSADDLRLPTPPARR